MWNERREGLSRLRQDLQQDLLMAPSWFTYSRNHPNSLMVSCPACRASVRNKTADLVSHADRHTQAELEHWFMLKAFS